MDEAERHVKDSVISKLLHLWYRDCENDLLFYTV